ncbi:porin family protein [Mucilaginibacter sp. SP1R1]|uniref:porin family protein n=1 Tax=Mucilaginibacter sp. SP1R1 TaxID=2723091 RepID=UPI0016195D07|nr:porin family protein [Mucilaginibacter sp. SP1R1]MBB6152701.1 hypothetical protein [Mucilaginibacter sp. SP1R1]
MKNKKLQISLLLPLLIMTGVVAQAQIKIGEVAGIGFSNISEKSADGDKANTQNMPGLRVGLTADVPLTGDFYIQPGLFYARKGFKQESGGFYGAAINLQVKADYIELPVNLLYKRKLGMGHLLLGAGPYLAYGTGGNWKSDGDIVLGDIRSKGEGSVAFRNNGSIRNDSEYIYGRPVDYGFTAILGYEFREHFTLQLNGIFGLANLIPSFNGSQLGGHLRNRGSGITIGYKI